MKKVYVVFIKHKKLPTKVLKTYIILRNNHHIGFNYIFPIRHKLITPILKKSFLRVQNCVTDFVTLSQP